MASHWFPPVLAAMVEHHGLTFFETSQDGSQTMLIAEDIISEWGISGYFAYRINLIYPAAIPMKQDMQSMTGWHPDYDNITLPATVIGAIALDVVKSLHEQSDDDNRIDIASLMQEMDNTINTNSPVVPILVGM